MCRLGLRRLEEEEEARRRVEDGAAARVAHHVCHSPPQDTNAGVQTALRRQVNVE